MISDNVIGSGTGAPKQGAALLAGRLRCRRCGRKLTVQYTGAQHRVLRYCCIRGRLDNGEPSCIAFGGIPVDEAISREILRVVEPAAIEAAVLAKEEADILNTIEMHPAFRLEHIFYDFDDRPVSWGRFICRGDRLSFTTTVGIGSKL